MWMVASSWVLEKGSPSLVNQLISSTQLSHCSTRMLSRDDPQLLDHDRVTILVIGRPSTEQPKWWSVAPCLAAYYGMFWWRLKGRVQSKRNEPVNFEACALWWVVHVRIVLACSSKRFHLWNDEHCSFPNLSDMNIQKRFLWWWLCFVFGTMQMKNHCENSALLSFLMASLMFWGSLHSKTLMFRQNVDQST